MRITAITDTTDIRARLRQYAALMNKEVSETLRRFAVVACRNLANTTQPFSGGEKAVTEKGRKLGEMAVMVDINKVFYVPTRDGGFSKMLTERAEASLRKRNRGKTDVGAGTEKFRRRINDYIGSGNTKALQNIAEDMGMTNFRRTIDPAIHKAARTGRRTKVRKPPGGMTLILNKESHLENYVAKRQKLVGLAKAGWAKCADLIPTTVKGPATRGIPQWVTRNKKKAQGSIQDLSRKAGNPKVLMTNRIPWTSNVLSPKEARKALDLAKRNFIEYMNKSMKAELRRRIKIAAG